ncbi:hypothetical protein DPMN_191330 [Dreissena polymorpha]|uniref:B box-type domain-containing protein n=1 Tax=Dreissena polymorpha TaxID=45954 RepID=A0A9D3Y0F6_DREPO|nr:hypothetical protein DPMN_191330 [Dreissena polymorpha]
MYCSDHSQLICSTCVEINHRLCFQVTQLSEAAKEKSADLNNLSVRTKNTLSRMKQFQIYQEDRMKSLKVSYHEHEKLIVDGMRLNLTSYLLECADSTVNETHEHMQYLVHNMRKKIRSLLADFDKSTIKDKKEELTLK